jgi:hypothetical protein
MLILLPVAAAACADLGLSGDFAALPLPLPLPLALALTAALAVAAVAAVAVPVPAAVALSGDSGIRPSSDGLGGSGGLAQPNLPGGKLYIVEMIAIERQ